jgi:hypothetical protein
MYTNNDSLSSDPLIILFAPWLIARYIFRTAETAQLAYAPLMPYLAGASALWILSFFLPGIPISSEMETFSQHAAGGVAATILFWYFVRAYRWRFAYWWQEIAALYFFVGGLGVANELFELATTKSGLIVVDGGDVWWDLLANTCGAALAFLFVFALRYSRT